MEKEALGKHISYLRRITIVSISIVSISTP